jgi:hypothetical protein
VRAQAPLAFHPPTADVLRVEAKEVLIFNHEPFEASSTTSP